jgi:hypothetical protein
MIPGYCTITNFVEKVETVSNSELRAIPLDYYSDEPLPIPNRGLNNRSNGFGDTLYGCQSYVHTRWPREDFREQHRYFELFKGDQSLGKVFISSNSLFDERGIEKLLDEARKTHEGTLTLTWTNSGPIIGKKEDHFFRPAERMVETPKRSYKATNHSPHRLDGYDSLDDSDY